MRFKASELVVPDVEVAKTAASFWLGAIPGVVVFIIIVIVGDFRDILFRALRIALLLFFALATCS